MTNDAQARPIPIYFLAYSPLCSPIYYPRGDRGALKGVQSPPPPLPRPLTNCGGTPAYTLYALSQDEPGWSGWSPNNSSGMVCGQCVVEQESMMRTIEVAFQCLERQCRAANTPLSCMGRVGAFSWLWGEVGLWVGFVEFSTIVHCIATSFPHLKHSCPCWVW
jgi:hypothetical protein